MKISISKSIRKVTNLLIIPAVIATGVLLGSADLADAKKSGVSLPSSSYKPIPDITTKFKVPAMLQNVPGTNNELQNKINEIYPTASAQGNPYNGTGLPFKLEGSDGEEFNGFCAQSYTPAKDNMSANGIVTDYRILKLMDVVSGGKPETMGDAQRIAIQIVLWGALNNNWSPDLFTKHISTKNSAYGAMTSVPDHVKKIEAAWGDIISTTTDPIAPLDILKGPFKAVCHKDKDKGNTTAVIEIDWKLMGGMAVKDINQVADIEYNGINATKVHSGTPGVYTQIKEGYGITPKDSAHYLIIPDARKKGQAKLDIQVTYKGNYKSLNEVSLIEYSGGGGYQPFLAIKRGKTSYETEVFWECPSDPPPPPGIEKGSDSTPIRWYNMPLAFGEIKNGIGYNETGVTTKGKYATTRDGETFETMNGVPSTERFYVNLGGTEGFLDVTYTLEDVQQDFRVQWETPYDGIPKVCPPGIAGVFSDTFKWKFTALHLQDATFRVFGDGKVRQDDLDMKLHIVNKEKEVGSYILEPNPAGLEVGPGVGDDKFNIGATKAWAPDQGIFMTSSVGPKCMAYKEDKKQEAYDKANANVGEIFAQNDKLEITIKDSKYVFVPSVNKKSSLAFKESGPYELDSTDGKRQNYFVPVEEKWDVWSKVKIWGYNGNPEDDGERSIKGTPLLLEDIPIDIKKGNGIYEFQKTEDANYLDYDSIVTTIKGETKDLMDNVDELMDGVNKGKSTVYKSPLDPTNKKYYKQENQLWLQYTNWQAPVREGDNGLVFKHSGNEPDGIADETLEDNPRYRSINPILIHDPTTALYSWISDIPDSQLQDQRINASDERFSKHPSTEKGSSRQYIDYDFQVTIPNVAAFETYWGQIAKNSKREGFEDLDFTYPGTLGKGYKGDAVDQITDRSYENPYLGATGWDVSKWNTAKYIKFPYAVFYYKNTGESGGDEKGFYDAGQWIKLYDDNHTVKVGDPTVFNFHMASEQKDVKDGVIYVTAETLNSQPGVADNAEALYLSGEQYINGTRNTEGTNVGKYNIARDGEAIYSAVNQINVDGIGRIGNVLASDTSDPAWTGVFWDAKNGKIDTTKAVQKDYGTTFNYYESTVLPNATGFAGYDRYKTLTPWHGQMEPMHSLPVTTNVFTKGKEDQVVKLGYNLGGSLQTVGDYDYSMWIYPQNQLAGKFATGNPSQHFKLIASDPFMTGAKYQEYYDSDVNNTLHGNAGLLGKDYKARYQHLLSSSLADPRMKMSGWEKSSATYQKAVQLGSNKKILTGSPSWIVIPRSLRTLMGSDDTQGRWGPGGLNDNNGYGAKSDKGSADCPCSYENAQKWNWNYNLPQNTKIWFDKNPENTAKDGSPKFEAMTRDQYIITSMAFRTKVARTTYPGAGDEWQTEVKKPAIEFGDAYLVHDPQSIPDWDLTMFTNTGVNTLPDIENTTKDVPDGIIPDSNPSKPMTWDPTQEGNIGAPMIDIIWWNYSKPATTDKDNVGTH